LPQLCEAKTFILKGGEFALAISKEKKEQLVDQYVNWANDSQAMILTEYFGLTVKDLDDLRGKIRDAGGEYHIVKNRLGKVAFDKAGLELPDDYLVGSTAIAFAFEDAPGLAKVVNDYAKDSDFLKIKGGYLDKSPIDTQAVNALASLPPLPVMRSQLIGTLMAPASKLARLLAEPARQVATVLKAYADQDSEPATA
jgi:large subunit ribosomal protein L10